MFCCLSTFTSQREIMPRAKFIARIQFTKTMRNFHLDAFLFFFWFEFISSSFSLCIFLIIVCFICSHASDELRKKRKEFTSNWPGFQLCKVKWSWATRKTKWKSNRTMPKRTQICLSITDSDPSTRNLFSNFIFRCLCANRTKISVSDIDLTLPKYHFNFCVSIIRSSNEKN